MQKLYVFLIISLFCFLTLILNAEERGIQAIADFLDRSVTIGKQYVFLIGINSYREWPNLQNPVQDALALKDILTTHYFIDEIIELYDKDATKAAIIGTFGELQKKCGIHDSLLIFYAGHGYYDAEITNTGFWVPHDGGEDTLQQANWIPNPLIRKIISKFSSNHILLISDSCFAGDILELDRGPVKKPEKPAKRWIIEALQRTSRQVLTSGALEMVPDVSEFSNQLKRILLTNTDAFLDPQTIYVELKRDVNNTIPLYGVLKETAHQQGGSFFFLRKNPEHIPPEPGTLLVKIDADATIYLNGSLYKQVTPGEWRIDDLSPGKHILKIVFTDGKSQVKEVMTDAGAIKEVVFNKAPPAKDYFSIGAGFGLTFPLDYWGDVMDMGYCPLLAPGYTFGFPWGRIAVFMITGVTIQSVKPGLEGGFTMYAIPVGLGTGYRTHFAIPLYAFIETAGGVVIGLYEFREKADPNETSPVPSPFMLAQAGIGAECLPQLCVSAYFRFTRIYYENIAFNDLSPGVRIEYNFR